MLKPLSSFYDADSRFQFIVNFNAETGAVRNTTPDDLHHQVESYLLNEPVPEKVRNLFDLARNIYVYSWFVYDFATVAEQQAYANLEAALRHRYQEETGDTSPTLALGRLSDHAIENGWLNPADYEYAASWTPTGKLSHLEMIRMLRNKLAHGDFFLMPNGSLAAIELCYSIIKLIFPQKVPHQL